MVERVLVAIDDSRPATAALEYALARFNTAEIIVLHIIDAVDATNIRQRVLPEECKNQRDVAERIAETVLTDARTFADAAGANITITTRSGRPPRQILAYAEENDIDVIVLGTHGRSGLNRLLWGSISDLISHQSPVPVMTVPASATVPR